MTHARTRVLARRDPTAATRRSRSARCLAAAAMAAVLVAGLPASAGAQQDRYGDVSAGVHKPAIDALGERGLFEGTLCGHDTFCPGEPIERSTMAVWLIRALEDDEPPAIDASRFADVEAGD